MGNSLSEHESGESDVVSKQLYLTTINCNGLEVMRGVPQNPDIQERISLLRNKLNTVSTATTKQDADAMENERQSIFAELTERIPTEDDLFIGFENDQECLSDDELLIVERYMTRITNKGLSCFMLSEDERALFQSLIDLSDVINNDRMDEFSFCQNITQQHVRNADISSITQKKELYREMQPIIKRELERLKISQL